MIIATQTVNPYNEENILKDSIIRYSKSRNLDKNKIIQKKNVNSIAVQTECSESEISNHVTKSDYKSMEQENILKKQPNSVRFQNNVTGHHQPGEIPKYV